MGLFFAAAGVLALEVLFTRIFSVVMWYHFASMAIAVAMFGLSLGALLPYLLRRGEGPAGDGKAGPCPASRTTRSCLAASSLLFAAAPYVVLAAFRRYPVWAGSLLSLFHQPYFEPFRGAAASSARGMETLEVGLLLLLFSLPFVGAGALFSMAYSRPGREGRTYLQVMGGSAAGVVAYLAAMRAGSGPAAILFVSALFALAAAAESMSGDGPPVGAKRPLSTGAFFLAVAGLLVAAGVLEARSGHAEIRFVRGRYEPNLLWTRWDATSRVAVYPASGEEASRAWGVSPVYAGPVPPQIGMVVDDTGYTALFGTGREEASLEAFRYNIASAAYRIRGGGRALVIGPGGGKDILCARASGDFDVAAVEVNPLVVRAAMREFGDFTGRPYGAPKVRSVVAEGRHFLASDRSRYDVIQMTQVFGRIPPSAGAFTMTEDHLYTTEAFGAFLSHLEPDGLLTVTRFLHERRVFRILSLAREALRRAGASDPARHILALRDRGLLNILVRRAPWTEGDLAAARRFADEMRFQVAIAPDALPSGTAGRILSGEGGADSGPFDFSAPTDDRPFFYYTLKPATFLSAVALAGGEFEDRAVGLMRGFLFSAALLCAAFLVLPAALLARGDPDRPSLGGSAYMVLVGLAYVVWEIVMIRKLSLLLGAPVLAFAAGLTMILAFSALGGALAGEGTRRPRTGALALSVPVVAAYLFLMDGRVSALAGASPAVRWAAAAAYVFPPAVMMGRFFPLGIRIFRGRDGAVPFYVASNGAASVVGAALTQALSMNLGYRATTAAGAALYLLGALILFRAEGRGR